MTARQLYTGCLLATVVVTILFTFHGATGAPLLLGNQMTALSLIPRTEEQAVSLLEFLRNNPQYKDKAAQVQVDQEEVILVPHEDVAAVSNGLEEIGFQLGNSSDTYTVS